MSALKERTWDHVTQLLSVALLGIATCGSAWAGYQASLWDGIQNFRLADASYFSRESSKKSSLAGMQQNLDVGMFAAFARSMITNNAQVAEFSRARMRPEMQQALDAWLATKPLTNPSAPISPFVMPEYRLKLNEDAEAFQQRAAQTYREASRANATGDRYSLLTVLFAAVLFLAGLVANVPAGASRWILLALSMTLMIIGAILLTRLSVAPLAPL